MDPQAWLEQGNLTEALAQARREVAAQPGNAGRRFLLFELLALQEDFAGAEAELRQLAAADPSLGQGMGLFLGLIEAERKRHALLLRGQGDPPVALQEPPGYGAAFLQAVQSLGGGRGEEAKRLLEQAWKSVPKPAGTLDGQRFTDLRDADDLLGPFLEVVVPGAYLWVPFEQIKRLEFRPPRGYQDVIWMPAYLETRGGARGDLWVPSLYCGTGAQDDFLKLGRMTSFEYPSEIARGLGQRDLKIDNSFLKGIRQVKEIVFD